MKNKLNKLLALSPDEWWLMLNAMFLLPVVTLMLTIFGFKRCQQLMGHFMLTESIHVKSRDSQEERIRIIYRMVNIVMKHGTYSENCLKHSLILWWLLAKNGIESEIIFGVEDDLDKKFSAHAWIRCNGKDLFDHAHNSFIAFT